MAKPIVAIVGRPNVGKSTLFNKLTGQRLSIVDDTPGVTRDRIYADCEWRGRVFTLIDTGGIEPKTNDIILSQMKRQAQMAIETADVVILVTDLQTGMVAADKEVANMLLKARKKLVLCVNKTDGIGQLPPEIFEFYNLGVGEPIAVSATHGRGTGDLLDAVFEELPKEPHDDDDNDAIKVAVIGKPNVGKSSLINRIVGHERLIVSDIPGTTRDAIDTPFEKAGDHYILIDTAGMRKKSKIDENIERYSVVRSLMAVERADVCVVMIDANTGVTEQDTKIAGVAHENGKAIIVAVNKWDAVEKDEKTMDKMRKEVMDGLSYMTYAPIIFISAKTGQRLNELFDLIKYVHSQNCIRITTGKLNEVLQEATGKVQPPTDRGKRLRIYYMTQASIKPPTFVIFCNDLELFHFSYQRYIENQIRSVFGLEGTPIRFIIREKGDKK
ncbi:MAG: ribosome biogenesis GTPase Der [Bacillota bacterium]|nr:ribosome biogenesis GTPase Der [Bacillota bacterium]